MAIKWGFEKYIKSNEDYYFIYQLTSNYNNPQELANTVIKQFIPQYSSSLPLLSSSPSSNSSPNIPSNNSSNSSSNLNLISTSSLANLSSNLINNISDVSQSLHNEGKAILVFTVKAGQIAYKIITNLANNSFWFPGSYGKLNEISNQLIVNEIEKLYRKEEFKQVILNLNDKISKKKDDKQINGLLRSWVDIQEEKKLFDVDDDYHRILNGDNDDDGDDDDDEFGDNHQYLFGTSQEISEFKVGKHQINLFEDYDHISRNFDQSINSNNINSNNDNYFNSDRSRNNSLHNSDNNINFDNFDDDDFQITPLL